MGKNIYELRKDGQVVDYLTCEEICKKIGAKKGQVHYAATYGKSLNGYMLEVVDKAISKNSKVYKEWDKFFKNLRRGLSA